MRSTVVTENGTARVLDPIGGWQQRLPLVGRHVIAWDGDPQPLVEIRHASPCGLHTTSHGYWDFLMTTRIIAVIAGHDPYFPTSVAGLALLADVAVRGTIATDHPDLACPVVCCRSPL